MASFQWKGRESPPPVWGSHGMAGQLFLLLSCTNPYCSEELGFIIEEKMDPSSEGRENRRKSESRE